MIPKELNEGVFDYELQEDQFMKNACSKMERLQLEGSPIAETSFYVSLGLLLTWRTIVSTK